MGAAIKAKPNKLRDLQASLGKNNSGMAELIGVTRKTWESAIEGKNVSAVFMAKVAIAFNVNFDVYFETAENAAAA